jgi:shikimate kinase
MDIIDNLVLVGYRGVGKSAVARHLARLTGWELCSLDEMLKKRFSQGLQEFIQANGWPAFRAAETELLKELQGCKGVVIDCGGGIVETPENLPLLKSLGTVVWLTASETQIRNRILSSRSMRLSLTGSSAADPDEIHAVLQRRNPLYRQIADITIDSTGMESYDAAQLICPPRSRRHPPRQDLLAPAAETGGDADDTAL